MTRSAPPFRWLTALLAVVVLACAAGPAAAAVADSLGPACCDDRCPMASHGAPVPEAPSSHEGPVCCAPAPAPAHDVATLPAPMVASPVLVVAALAAALPAAEPSAAVPPRDTGPPPGLRRHLALSVFRV